MTDCLVIGAGPAGLAAAIAAARAGRDVAVLEKNDQPGRKLLLTGGGRCNLVDPSVAPLDTLVEFGRDGAFLRDALARFDYAEFLRSLHVATEIDPSDGRHYVIGGARKMLSAMVAAATNADARIIAGSRVKSIRRAADGFDISAPSPLEGEGRGEGSSPSPLEVHPEALREREGRLSRGSAREGEGFRAKRLILAAGGVTYPSTGSSGDALAWAESLGHRVDPPHPALGGLATKPSFAALAGITVADAALTLTVDGRKRGSRRGTILLTHVGISGPAAVDLSLDYVRAVASSSSYVGGRLCAVPLPNSQNTGGHIGPPLHKQLEIDFLPEASLAEVEEHLSKRGRHAASRALEGLPAAQQIPARLALELVRAAGILSSGPLDHASKAALRALARSLKSTRLAVVGLEDPERAVVTLGGVSVKDIHPRTMESRLVPGLFFAGELLSPAGPCGGYNLLMAFATGTLAGTAGDK